MQDIPKHLKTSVVIMMPVLWLAAIILALNITSPLVAGPAGILVVFLLFYGFAASTSYVLIRTGLYVWKITTKKSTVGRRLSAYLASVLALGPVFLVALNTLGQIGPVEIILIVVLVGLGCFYVVRREAV